MKMQRFKVERIAAAEKKYNLGEPYDSDPVARTGLDLQVAAVNYANNADLSKDTRFALLAEAARKYIETTEAVRVEADSPDAADR